MRRSLIALSAIALLASAACGSGDGGGALVTPGDDDPAITSTTAAGGDAPAVGMANPASVHCADKGGTEASWQNADGAFGICEFPDGTECESWSYFRGECAPGEHREAPERDGATRRS